MTTEGIDTLELAKVELASAMVPTPQDIMTELGPLGRLYFTEQCVYELLAAYAGDLAQYEGSADDPPEEATRALEAIAQAAGMLDAACIAMGILPPDAAPPTT